MAGLFKLGNEFQRRMGGPAEVKLCRFGILAERDKEGLPEGALKLRVFRCALPVGELEPDPELELERDTELLREGLLELVPELGLELAEVPDWEEVLAALF